MGLWMFVAKVRKRHFNREIPVPATKILHFHVLNVADVSGFDGGGCHVLVWHCDLGEIVYLLTMI